MLPAEARLQICFVPNITYKSVGASTGVEYSLCSYFTCSIAYLSLRTWYTVIAADGFPSLQHFTGSCRAAVRAHWSRHLSHRNKQTHTDITLWLHSWLKCSLLAPHLCATLHPREVPADLEFLSDRQRRIVVPDCHQLNAATCSSLPVDQLICGHRVSVCIKWHIITILWKTDFLQLSKNLWTWNGRIQEVNNVKYIFILGRKWRICLDRPVWTLSWWVCHTLL